VTRAGFDASEGAEALGFYLGLRPARQ